MFYLHYLPGFREFFSTGLFDCPDDDQPGKIKYHVNQYLPFTTKHLSVFFCPTSHEKFYFFMSVKWHFGVITGKNSEGRLKARNEIFK